jgi:O-antigen/teichoic acid export membrane protein
MASAEPVVARGHGVVNGTSLDRNEVRRRALSGTILLSGNGVALQAIGFGVTVVFARVLGPAGLGVVAFGMTLMTLVRYVGGGQAFAGTLIRAHEDPSPAELHSMLGLQLILVGSLTAVAAGTALAFGEVGRVTAVMLLALPIVAFRTPAVVLLERQLRYRAITLTDTADTLTYYAWGLATLALGWGVWGIATAMIARALAGTFVIVALAPRRVIAPRFSWSRSRHMLGFVQGV